MCLHNIFMYSKKIEKQDTINKILCQSKKKTLITKKGT